MIFKQWQQVLDGTKTQTRRPVKEGESYHVEELGRGAVSKHWITRFAFMPAAGDQLLYYNAMNPKWRIGWDYAVQPGRGKKSVGRIRITKIRREKLQQIKSNTWDAKAEMGYLVPARHFIWGIRTWHKFRDLWNSVYKAPYRWEDNPDVWVLEFELMEKLNHAD